MSKQCCTCKQTLDASCFYKATRTADGLRKQCKECTNKSNRKSYSTHKDSKHAYYEKNIEHIKEMARIRHQEQTALKPPKVKPTLEERKQRRAYMRRIREKERRVTDTNWCIIQRIRARIRAMYRKQGSVKSQGTLKLIGCTFEELANHLGPKPDGEYHIDHICPLDQAMNQSELEKLCHYSNLRWLPACENIRKWAHRTPESEQMCKAILCRDWIDRT